MYFAILCAITMYAMFGFVPNYYVCNPIHVANS